MVDPKGAEGLIATLDAGLFYTAAGEASCHGDRSQAFIEAASAITTLTPPEQTP